MQNIIIADDHPIYRSGIKSVVEKIPFTKIIGEAINGIDAYQLIIGLRPEIAIMDIEMPLLSGLDVCRKVMNEKHTTKIILLTMHKEKHFFNDAMSNGVSGYLLKDSAGQELINCIDVVKAGQKYVSEQIHSYLFDYITQSDSDDFQKIKSSLTPTEKVILKLISEGKTSGEIATLLFVSPNTIENHRANMIKKLKIEGGKNALLKFALSVKIYL
jgi:DNA-binding NarL/FixJ family response regulator